MDIEHIGETITAQVPAVFLALISVLSSSTLTSAPMFAAPSVIALSILPSFVVVELVCQLAIHGVSQAEVESHLQSPGLSDDDFHGSVSQTVNHSSSRTSDVSGGKVYSAQSIIHVQRQHLSEELIASTSRLGYTGPHIRVDIDAEIFSLAQES